MPDAGVGRVLSRHPLGYVSKSAAAGTFLCEMSVGRRGWDQIRVVE